MALSSHYEVAVRELEREDEVANRDTFYGDRAEAMRRHRELATVHALLELGSALERIAGPFGEHHLWTRSGDVV